MTTDTTTPAAKPARRANALTPASTSTPAASPTSKSDTVVKLLLRTKGATPVELIAATDWQPHSVRAFLSGLRKKGRAIVREPRKNGDAAYRIVVADAADSPPATEPSAAVAPGTADLAAAASAAA